MTSGPGVPVMTSVPAEPICVIGIPPQIEPEGRVLT